MKHTVALIILLAIGIAAIIPSASFSQGTNSKGQNSIEQEILNLEKEWFEAYQKSDADTVDRIEADDFTVVTATSGAFGTKETQIPNIRNRDETMRKRMASVTRTLEQAKVRIYENVVVVNGISVASQREDTGTTKVISKYLYTGVWAKREGRWRIVNAQFTAFPPPKPQSGN